MLPSASASLTSLARLLKLLGLMMVICVAVLLLLWLPVWRVFEELVSSGQVLQLGISNIYDLTALQRIYKEASVKPAVVQNRCDD